MQIKDSDGYSCALADRIFSRFEQKWVIAELLALLVEKAGITEAELKDCGIIDSDESIEEKQ